MLRKITAYILITTFMALSMGDGLHELSPFSHDTSEKCAISELHIETPDSNHDSGCDLCNSLASLVLFAERPTLLPIHGAAFTIEFESASEVRSVALFAFQGRAPPVRLS